jgi:integrase
MLVASGEIRSLKDGRRQRVLLARVDELYAADRLVLVFGLRRGEVLGLVWEDIDLEAGQLTGGYADFSEPLTSWSQRETYAQVSSDQTRAALR